MSAPSALAVYPCLAYRDVRRALGWLETTFGIEGRVLGNPAAGAPVHALLQTPGGTILVESERPYELHGVHAGRGWVYVTVADADAHYRHASSLGAHVHGEPHDFGDSFRGYSADDLEGNLWTFGTATP